MVELTPEQCPNGHPLGPGKVLIGWQPCSCASKDKGGPGGHRTIVCVTCGVTLYRPPHDRGYEESPVWGHGAKPDNS